MFYVNVSTAAGTTGRMVEGDSLTVGRSEDSDLVISHETLSRRHLTLTKRGNQIFVEDLGSSNGTFKNGERLMKRSPTLLGEYDELTMGEADVRLTVAFAPNAVAPTPARSASRIDAASPTRAMRIEPVVEDKPVDPNVAEAIVLEEVSKARFRPHWASVGIGAALVPILVLIVHLLQPTPTPVAEVPAPLAAPTAPAATPPREPVAAVPIIRRVPTATGYQMSYVDNVNLISGFAHKYLGDDFQRRLTREVVPTAAKAWKMDETRVVQALGVTAELVKLLEDRRASVGETPVEKTESMRRLEADSRAQLTEILGTPTRVQSLMQLEKPLYER